jgi:hypothetical protein
MDLLLIMNLGSIDELLDFFLEDLIESDELTRPELIVLLDNFLKIVNEMASRGVTDSIPRTIRSKYAASKW